MDGAPDNLPEHPSSSINTAIMSSDEGKVDVLMVGTGEYTTGYVGGAAADRYAIYPMSMSPGLKLWFLQEDRLASPALTPHIYKSNPFRLIVP